MYTTQNSTQQRTLCQCPPTITTNNQLCAPCAEEWAQWAREIDAYEADQFGRYAIESDALDHQIYASHDIGYVRGAAA